ncbi:hypothetical protein [Eggerthella hominis]|uniref:hypothetical protein n=1 Tax=Eggerthella hominis TaxID=2763043 RepID=UPI00344ECE72
MATKRKRTRESNTAASVTDAAKPEASGRIAPRKRTDAPPPKAKGRTGATPRVAGAAGAATGAGADAAASAADASVESARERRERRGTAAKPRKRRWPLVVTGSVLLVILLAVGGFSWDRWLRYDDAREFLGEWQTHGTTAVVVIDGETIKLTEDVSWTYTLDTGAKTIAFTFGNMEGSGRYRFSLDRSQLVITDGDGYSWLSTLADDIAWQFDQLVRAIQGQPQEEPPSGDGYTVLDRLSHDAAATPQTGTPVEPEPEPEPTPDPEPTTEPEATPAPESKPESETTPESDAGSTSAPDAAPESTDAGKNDDAGTSSAPSGVFDVSDLPA